MDSDVPGFEPTSGSVALHGPHASLFSHRYCADSEGCGGTARWDPLLQQLVVFLVRDAPGGTPYAFSFLLRNPGVAQPSVPVFAALQIEETRFPAAVVDRDLQTDLGATVPGAGVGDAAVMKVLPIELLYKDIGQAAPYPATINTITVTIGTTLPLYARAGAVIAISGLDGAVHPAGDIALAPKSCLGPADPGDWGGCEAFQPVGGDAPCTGTWDPVSRVLSVRVAGDLEMQRGYAFSFSVTNPSVSQASPPVAVRVQGPVPIAQQAMRPDMETDLGSSATCHDPCTTVFGAKAGDAAPLLVFEATFLCVSGVEEAAYYPKCANGPLSPCLTGSACAGYIGQSSPYPGSINTITVTYATSVPLTPGASIVISGLDGASRGHDATPEVGDIASVLVRGPALPPGCDATGGGFSLASAANGSPGTFQWTQAAEEVEMYVYGNGRSRAAWEYVVSFTLLNPASAQESPEVFIESLGVQIAPQPLFRDQRTILTPPLKIIEPAFVVKKIGQATALPGSENVITVTFSTNVPLAEGMKLQLTGFNGGVPTKPREDTAMLNASFPQVDLPQMLYASDVSGEPGKASFDYDVLTFTITERTVEFREYVFMIRVQNPNVPQDYQRVSIATLSGILISRVLMEPDLSGPDGIYGPFRVLEMLLQILEVGQSNPFPGADNTITFTLSPNLDISADLAISFTISGLKGARTLDSVLELSCNRGCVDACDVVQCDAENQCCTDRASVGVTCPEGVRRCADLAPNQVLCDTSFFSRASWRQSGSLEFWLARSMLATDETAVSFTLRNSLKAQAGQKLSIRTNFRNNTEVLTNPQDMINDAFWPPLQVQAPRFLRAHSFQSSASPCSPNTITVTLALNIPVIFVPRLTRNHPLHQAAPYHTHACPWRF